MDYEKKYKEAVCNIQKLLENGRKEGEVICAYEADFMSIFPELKESEDEKIRKSLIDMLKNDEKCYLKEIAWLEKQGTPAKLSEEEQNRFAKGVLTSCAMSFIDYLDAHKYEGKMCVSNGECEDIENAFHNAMWDKLHRYYGKYIDMNVIEKED